MLTLILLLIVGSALAYISQYNLTPVSLNLGYYVFSDMPLFYVIIGSLLTGLILATLIHSFRDISASLTIRNKRKEIKKNKNEVLELTRRVHQLELENEKLKHAPRKEPKDKNSL
jgi:uncharacterized integral membrane protein